MATNRNPYSKMSIENLTKRILETPKSSYPVVPDSHRMIVLSNPEYLSTLQPGDIVFSLNALYWHRFDNNCDGYTQRGGIYFVDKFTPMMYVRFRCWYVGQALEVFNSAEWIVEDKTRIIDPEVGMIAFWNEARIQEFCEKHKLGLEDIWLL